MNPSSNRINSLTLAAYLIEKGHPYDLENDGERRGQKVGAWVFQGKPIIADQMAEFKNGKALVEPRAYYSAVNRVRREMFEFLGRV